MWHNEPILAWGQRLPSSLLPRDPAFGFGGGGVLGQAFDEAGEVAGGFTLVLERLC